MQLAQKDETARKLITILNTKGELDKSGLMPYRKYEDKKIYIEACISTTLTYNKISLAIHLCETLSQPTIFGFGLSRNDNYENWTLVYSWKDDLDNQVGYVEYFRPGMWLEYIEELHQEITNEQKRLRNLHRKPINDSALFSKPE